MFPNLLGILLIPPFVNYKGKGVYSDWLADQWDERSVLGHARFYPGYQSQEKREGRKEALVK